MTDVLFALTGDVRRNSRALRQLRALTASGYRVTALTLGPAADGEAPTDGLTLRPVPLPDARGPRYFAAVHQRFRAAAAAVPARVYHASDLYVLPALAAAARRHGGRLVYDARERYPYVAATAGRPGVSAFWRALERRYVRRADAVFTVSPSIADDVQAAYRVPRPLVLYNAPPRRPAAPSPLLRRQTGLADARPLVLHQGQMRPDRGCTLLVQAMTYFPEGALVFLGDGPLRPALAEQAAAQGLSERVHFLDAVPPDALLPVTAGADVGVTLLENTCRNHRFALPNKLFEYLMAGLPVVASDLPELRRVVRGHDVGLVVDPTDAEALGQALRTACCDEAARARWQAHRAGALDAHSWEASEQRFLGAYMSLTDGPVE